MLVASPKVMPGKRRRPSDRMIPWISGCRTNPWSKFSPIPFPSSTLHFHDIFWHVQAHLHGHTMCLRNLMSLVWSASLLKYQVSQTRSHLWHIFVGWAHRFFSWAIRMFADSSHPKFAAEFQVFVSGLWVFVPCFPRFFRCFSMFFNWFCSQLNPSVPSRVKFPREFQGISGRTWLRLRPRPRWLPSMAQPWVVAAKWAWRARDAQFGLLDPWEFLQENLVKYSDVMGFNGTMNVIFIDVLFPLVGWLIEGFEETPLTGKWW